MNGAKKYHFKSNKKIRLLMLALAVLATPFVYYAMQQAPYQASTKDKKETWLTVFVHGIMSVKPHLSINNFLHFMTDNIQNTLYSQTVAYMREDPFFFKNQAMLGYGLINVNPNAIEKGNTSSGVAYFCEQMHNHSGAPEVNNLYYTFGWNGLLSPTERYQESKKLFIALEKEVERLRKQNIEPKVRVIGYSHGANLALNLGAAHARAFPSSTLSVDELFLLGAPIQPDTDYLVNDSVFKRIYNIYSLRDRIQKIEFFSFNRFFSGRYIEERKGLTLPDKLVQVQFKVMRNTNRYYFNSEKLEKSKNLDNPGIVTGRSSLLRDASPGHAELWFFGWTPAHYRQNYPLCPLPTISLAPFISHHLKDVNVHGQHIIFDVRPEHEYILVRKPDQKTVDTVIPFVPHYELEHMKSMAFKFAPESYTAEEYNQHVQKAIAKGRASYHRRYEHANLQSKSARCKLRKQRRNSQYYQVTAADY